MHHTSVAIVPPDAAWHHLQAARWHLRDRGLWRWPPHANLLYPFVAPDRFGEAAPILQAALTSVEPFEVKLSEFHIFAHKRSATLWLKPQPSRVNALVELQTALQDAMPQCDTQTAGHGGSFTAHFTVGHFESEEAAAEGRAAILTSGVWPASGVSFRVDEVVLMARDGAEGQFEPRYVLPLGRIATRPAVGALPSDKTSFKGMLSTMPDFCVKDSTAGHRNRQRRRKGRGRAPMQG